MYYNIDKFIKETKKAVTHKNGQKSIKFSLKPYEYDEYKPNTYKIKVFDIVDFETIVKEISEISEEEFIKSRKYDDYKFPATLVVTDLYDFADDI